MKNSSCQLSFLILRYGLFFQKNEQSDLSYFIGYVTLSSFLIWMLFYSVFLRKKQKIAGACFLIIYVPYIVKEQQLIQQQSIAQSKEKLKRIKEMQK